MKLGLNQRWFRSASPAILVMVITLSAAPVGAQVTPANANTQLRSANNGLPVVQIAKPNAAGLSVNQYTTYNVGSSGLILNNNATGAQVTTRLAGLVDSNPNLTTSAKVILNQVTSTSPSVLAGYTEVAGARADVVVANPNGITCGGCGAINISAFTLTTGVPNIGTNGNLVGFDVQQGTITLSGAGLDAQTTDYAALVGRKIAINAPVYGTTMDAVAGSNTWDYAAHTATVATPSGAAPDYAIDVSALGGMYANRIRLIATENGVGVRALGQVAASGDDLTITAAGDIVLNSQVSAQRDLLITTTASDATAISATGASLTAGRNLTLASGGGTTITGGAIVADGNVSLTAASLTDAASTVAITNNNQRYAGGALSLTVGGATSLSGVSYGANGAITGAAGSLAATSGGALYSNTGALSLTATTGDLNLGAYKVSSPGNIALTATRGAIVTAAASGAGVVSTTGAVTLTAANGLANAGAIAADQGGITLRLGGTSTNTGLISAIANIVLADVSGGASESFINASTGQFLAAGSFTGAANAFRNNSGTVQANLGTTLTAASLTNSGNFIGSVGPASDATFTLGSLNNSGVLQSAENLTLHVSGALNNSGTIYVAKALTLDGTAAGTNTATGAIQANSIVATLAGLANDGSLVSTTDLGLTVTGDIANTGAIGAGGMLTLGAGSLENTNPVSTTTPAPVATIQSAIDGALTVTGPLTNNGAIYLANTSGDGVVTAGTFANQAGGLLASQANLTLNLSGATFTDAGDVIAADSLTITGAGAALAVSNQATGYLQAGDAAGDVLTIQGNGVGLTVAAGSVVTGHDLSLTLAGLTNAGALSANNSLSYTATDVSNSGVIFAGTTVAGSSTTLINTTTGGIQGTTGVALTTSSALENDGDILTPSGSAANVTITAGVLTNAAGAYLQSDNALTLNLTGPTLANVGTINSSGDLAIHGGTTALSITNSGSGVIDAQSPSATLAALTIDGSAVSLDNQTSASIVGDHLALTVHDLTNDGALGATYGANVLTVATSVTNSGTLVLSADAAGSGTISAASLTNSGTLKSNNDLTLNLSTALTNSGTLQAVNALSILAGANAATFTNEGAGTIGAGGTLTLTGANAGATFMGSGQVSGAVVNATLGSLFNQTPLVSSGDLTLTVGGALTDTSTLGAGGTLSVDAGSLSNLGILPIQSTVGGVLIISGALINSGNIYLAAGRGDGTITAGTVNNVGDVASQGSLTFNITGATLDNAGVIYAGDNLNFNGAGSVLAITNKVGGTIETAVATPTTTGLINITGSNVGLNNLAGIGASGAVGVGTIVGDNLDLSVSNFTNQGVIESRGDLTLVGSSGGTGALQNAGTLYAAGGSASITAGSFSNLAGATFQADNGATFVLTGDFSNAGGVIASTDGVSNLVIGAANFSNLGPMTGAAIVQSSHGVTLNLAGSSLSNTGDIISAADMGIHGGTVALAISNTGGGVIAARSGTATPATLTIDGSAVSLTNGANSSLAGDAMALTVNGTDGLANLGQIVAGAGGAVINVQNALVNKDVLLSSGVAQLTTGSYENDTGAITQVASGFLKVNTGFANHGTLYSTGQFTIVAPAITLDNSGSSGAGNAAFIQSGGNLIFQGTGISLDNNAYGVVVANNISANINTLDNSGTFQSAGVGYNLTFQTLINRAGGLVNFDFPFTYAFGGGNYAGLTVGTLNNAGTIQSYNDLFFRVANFTNSSTGVISAQGQLFIQYQNPGVTMIDAGKLSAALGNLSIYGENPTTFNNYNVDLTVTSSGSLYGADISITAGTLELQNGGAITSTASTYITADTLKLDGSASRIITDTTGELISSGVYVPTNSTITLANTFSNNGLIYSNGNLLFSITGANQELFNNQNSAISAAGNLTLSTNSYITNKGELYAGGNLTISAPNQVWNQATTTDAESTTVSLGAIDAGGDLSITTGHLLNNSEINASGAITIIAGSIDNAVAGDWSRTSTLTTNDTPYNNFTSQGTPLCIGSAIVGACAQTNQAYFIAETVYTDTFNNHLTTPNYTPQIVAGGTLTLKNFTSATNVGATLSGQTVDLIGANGAQFLNDSLGLVSTETDYSYYVEQSYRQSYFVFGGLTSYSAPVVSNGTVASCRATPLSTEACVGAPASFGVTGNVDRAIYVTQLYSAPTNGVFAVNLNGTNFGLTNVGSPLGADVVARIGAGDSGATLSGGATMVSGTAATVSARGASTASDASSAAPGAGGAIAAASIGNVPGLNSAPQTLVAKTGATGVVVTPPVAGTTVGGKPAVTIAGTTVILPTNPNGLFVVAPGAGGKYLVETNPLYTLPVTDLSSDLLVQALGLNPDDVEKRLGDADYEAYLIDQQLLGETGKQLLASYGDLNSELAGLYGNAAADVASQGLVFGRPLSDTQVAQLPNDIIWMVSAVVNGQTVLTPVVYLSPATKASLVTGSGIIADNVDLQLTSLTNNGGSIIGTQTNSIVASGDVNNTGGGLIAGDQVYLQSTGGVVNNLNSTIKGVQTAAVLANGQLTNLGGTITAQDIGLRSENEGVDLTGGTIAAGNSLAIDVKKDIDINGSNNISGKNLSLTSHGGSINVVTQTAQQGNSVVAGPVASISASESLSLNAADNVNIQGGNVSAGKDLSIVAGENVNIGTVGTSTSSSTSSKKGRNTAFSSSSSTTQVGSTVSAGNDLYIQSGGDTNINGSSVSAGNDAAIIAGGALNITSATNSTSNASATKNKGTFSSSSSSYSNTTTTNSASNVTTGGNLYTKSGGATNIVGSNLNVTGDAALIAGGALNVVGAATTSVTDLASKKSGILTGSSSTSHVASTTNNASNVTVGGNLVTQSAGDTNIIGSNVNVAGDAALLSGGKLNIAQATNTTVTNTTASHKNAISSSSSKVNETQTTDAGSNVNIGGTGYIQTNGDVNIAGGSNVATGGDLVLDTQGHDVNITAGANTKVIDATTQKSGLGVGNALYGKITTTSHDETSKNDASSLSVGGQIDSTDNKNVLIQGSNVSAADGGVFTGTDSFKVLAGADTEHSNSETVTETVLGVGSTSSSSSKASAGATASATKNNTGLTAGASAGASAEAKGANDSSLTLYSKTVTDTKADSSTSVGSNVTFGGNGYIDGGKNLTIQGSNVGTTNGADLTVHAQNVNILAAENTATSSTTSKTDSVGIYVDSKGAANAQANVAAQAGLSADISTSSPGVGASASASASAHAEGSTMVTFGARQTTTSDATDTLTHTGSTLSADGNLNIIADNTLTTQGATLNATNGSVTEAAKDINNLAAVDHDYSTSSSKQVTEGIYVKASGAADAAVSVSANASLSGKSTGEEHTATVSGEVGAGFRVGYEGSGSTDNSTSVVSTTITSGGDINRIASGTITDQGTQLTAGGNINQSAKTILDQAISSTTLKSDSSTENESEFGVVANATAGTDNHHGAGIQQSNDFSQSGETTGSSTAVTSTYTAGGSINSVSSGKTTLQGATLSGANGVNLQAGSLDYNAAQNTTSGGSADKSLDESVTVDVLGKNVNAAVGYDQANENTSTVANVGGSVSSTGGKVNIVTTGGDANFTGTQVTGAAGSNVVAQGGNVNLFAAQTIAKDNSNSASVDVDITVGKPKGEGLEEKAGGGFQTITSTDVTNQVASISSTGGQTNVVGNNVTLQGAQVFGGTGVNVVATNGRVAQGTATDTSTQTGGGFDLDLKATVKQTKTSTTDANGKTTTKTENEAEPEGEGGFNVLSASTSNKTNSAVVSGAGPDTNFVGQAASPIQVQQLSPLTAPPTQTIPTQVQGVVPTNAASADVPIDTSGMKGGIFNPLAKAARTTTSVTPTAPASQSVITPAFQGTAGEASSASPTAIGGQTTTGVQLGNLTRPVKPAPALSAPTAVSAAQAIQAPVQQGAALSGALATALSQGRALPTTSGGAVPVTSVPGITAEYRALTPTPVTGPTPPTAPVAPPAPPTTPITPINPVTPQPPIVPTQPTVPNTPVQPITPTQPTQPTMPVTPPAPPVEPTQPVTPPVIPTPLIQPIVPTQPALPPVRPSVPVTPVTPTPPVQPTAPMSPVEPAPPTTPPSPPVQPTVPITPTQPAPPPVIPTPPGQPTVPTAPSITPTQPSAPVTPTLPAPPPATPVTTPALPSPPAATPRPVPGKPSDPTPKVVQVNPQTVTPVIPPIPIGTMVTATTSTGQMLPCWITVDPRTGAISANPSAEDAVQDTPVIVVEQVPQLDGSVRSLPIKIKPSAFGIGGSHCSQIRTNPVPNTQGKPGAGAPAH